MDPYDKDPYDIDPYNMDTYDMVHMTWIIWYDPLNSQISGYFPLGRIPSHTTKR